MSYNDRVKAKQLLDALHTAGIKAYAWGYVYSKKPEAEANLAIEALEMGFDGYFWNAEIHMKNHPKAADTMCKIVREYVDAKCPQKVLGYSTFCRIQNQTGLPLEVYDKYADVAMPQVYFSWFKGWSPKSAAAKTMNIWMTAQASWGHVAKPLIPTLESSNGTADMPETSSVDLTDAAKGFHGYFGVNFYSWDVANDDLWKVIRNAPGNLSYQRQKNAAKARALAHGEPLL